MSPDKHPENSKAVETFQKLQKAKEILSNAESRARYDHWRRSQMSMSFEQWEALADSVKTSMHWAVRSKKDLMLEGSEQTYTNTAQNKERSEQRETKQGDPDSTPEKMMQKESESPEKGISPQNPDSPGLSDWNCGHLRFRWSGDTPSELLRKFRNYEIWSVVALWGRVRPSSVLPKPVFVHSFKMLSVFVSCSVWSSPPTLNPLLQCALCYFVLGIEPRTSHTLCNIDCYFLPLMLFEEIVVSCSLFQYLSQLRLSDTLVSKTILRSYVVCILCFSC